MGYKILAVYRTSHKIQYLNFYKISQLTESEDKKQRTITAFICYLYNRPVLYTPFYLSLYPLLVISATPLSRVMKSTQLQHPT